MKFVVMAIMMMGMAGVVAAQQAGQPSKNSGTVNEMSASPDQNQMLVGQRPLTATGGVAGGVPDDTDRVNGKAYPVGSGTPSGAAPTGTAPGTSGSTDPRSSRQMTDRAAMAAAKKPAAVNISTDANAPASRLRKQTPSAGAAAKTKASIGGQTKDTRK